jgi:hypothetical protein|tara:strand:- start:4229 stop:4408 length:180 start_codon:yes stop_codon:yes gene_type:complete
MMDGVYVGLVSWVNKTYIDTIYMNGSITAFEYTKLEKLLTSEDKNNVQLGINILYSKDY